MRSASVSHALLCGFALLLPMTIHADDKVRVVALGDSITRGVRQGVKADQTYSALLESALKKKGVEAEVVNVGIGGERTDQALQRLEKGVIAKMPAAVTVCYGTNDSYVDRGKKEPRLTAKEYGENLRKIVKALRDAGVKPVLMTPPRWGDKAARNGNGEHPNVLLEQYVKVCREVAADTKTPLVDHFAHWTKKAKEGTNVSTWMTDECHPNPEGHKIIAETMLPVVLEAARGK
jgi:acyl-CoA thioesterase-1